MRTQHVRRLILDKLCEAGTEGDKKPYGERPVAEIEARHIRAIRDENADRPEAANGILKALRQVFAYAPLGRTIRRQVEPYSRREVPQVEGRRPPLWDDRKSRDIREFPQGRHYGPPRTGAPALHRPAAIQRCQARAVECERRVADVHTGEERCQKSDHLGDPDHPGLAGHRRPDAGN